MTQFQAWFLKFAIVVSAVSSIHATAFAKSTSFDTDGSSLNLNPISLLENVVTSEHPMEAAVCNCSLRSGNTNFVAPQESEVGLLESTGKLLNDTYSTAVTWSVTKAKTAVASIGNLVGSSIRPGCKSIGSGSASYYGQGDGFAGKKTASGKRLQPGAAMVAHRTLPFGTKVIIKDKATGKTAEATVEDRGPFIRGRVIDLTPAVFKKLKPLSAGVLRAVEVYVCS